MKLPIDDDEICKTICQWCEKDYVADSHNGTTSLHHHLLKCPKQNDEKERNVSQRNISQEEFCEMLAKAIVKHNLPFTFVEYEGSRKLFTYLNPEVKHISRNTSKADVLKIYNKEKDEIRNKLKSIPGRICLTSDLWTSITSEGYICLTTHYVDENWQLKNIILNFCHMPPPYHRNSFIREDLKFFGRLGY